MKTTKLRRLPEINVDSFEPVPGGGETYWHRFRPQANDSMIGSESDQLI